MSAEATEATHDARMDHFDTGHAEGLLNLIRASHWSCCPAPMDAGRSQQETYQRAATKIKEGELRKK